MFIWKKRIRPVNPTQELASKIMDVLVAAKTPCSLEEICSGNRYLSRQSAFRVKRMVDDLVHDGRAKVMRQKNKSGYIKCYYFVERK